MWMEYSYAERTCPGDGARHGELQKVSQGRDSSGVCGTCESLISRHEDRKRGEVVSVDADHVEADVEDEVGSQRAHEGLDVA